jgi:hypothetical protein
LSTKLSALTCVLKKSFWRLCTTTTSGMFAAESASSCAICVEIRCVLLVPPTAEVSVVTYSHGYRKVAAHQRGLVPSRCEYWSAMLSPAKAIFMGR